MCNLIHTKDRGKIKPKKITCCKKSENERERETED